MKGKNIIRALVLAEILAWPSVEVDRLQVARGQAGAAQQLAPPGCLPPGQEASSVRQKLAQARQVELAVRSQAPAKP